MKTINTIIVFLVLLLSKITRMEIKGRIIETAIKLFLNFGIRGVTMDMIAKEAGVSKRTIYENFKDKTEVLETCLLEMDRVKHEEMINLKTCGSNIIETIYQLANFHIKTLQTINPLFFHDLQKIYPTLWKNSLDKKDKDGISEIHKLFRKGINEGLIRPDIHLEVASRVMLEHFKLALTLELQRHRGYDRNILFENIILNYFRGIATNKGLDILKNYQAKAL